MAHPLGTEPSASELQEVVQELRRIHQRSGIASVAAVGRLILERFFGGSVKSWQDGSRHKERSLRRLARCESCPYSKSALHQAIRVHLVLAELPIVQTYEHIGPSHIVVTLALNHTQRARLLRAAEDQRLSVRSLRAEVERCQNGVAFAERNRRGRPRQAQATRAVIAVSQAKSKVMAALDLLQVEGIGMEAVPELRKALGELEAICARAAEGAYRPISEVPPPLESAVDLLPPTRRFRPPKTQKRASSGLLASHR